MSEAWLERWVEGRIGWHQPQGNDSLKRYWRPGKRRVLVPLCGKSYDLVWLEEQGNDVVGIELSVLAAEAFFEENGLQFRRSSGGTRFEAVDRRITIVCGDYFEFEDQGFDGHFDRGALAALPRSMRADYAAHTSERLTPDAFQLVITLEYDDTIASGPPFSIDSEEVLSYWPELERVAAYDDIDNGPPKFRDAGLTEMIEVVWRSL